MEAVIQGSLDLRHLTVLEGTRLCTALKKISSHADHEEETSEACATGDQSALKRVELSFAKSAFS